MTIHFLQINLYISLKVLTWNHQKLNYHKSECISKMLSARKSFTSVRWQITYIHSINHLTSLDTNSSIFKKHKGDYIYLASISTLVEKIAKLILRRGIYVIWAGMSQSQTHRSPTAMPRNTVWKTKRGKLKHYALVIWTLRDAYMYEYALCALVISDT